MEAGDTREATIERELREALREAQLQWLLEEVDRTIAEGRAVVIGRRGERLPFGPEFDAREGEVTAEAFTTEERIQLIVDALRRTLVDAPALAESASRLIAGDDSAIEVVFLDPVSGDRRRDVPSADQRTAANAAAADLQAVLMEIERSIAT